MNPNQKNELEKATEDERLLRLHQLQILDSVKEPEFENLVLLTSQTLDIPMVGISFLDAQRQWFKAQRGFEENNLPREKAFCNLSIQQTEPLIISDLTKENPFRLSDYVTQEPHLRFYAGVSLLSTEGLGLGTLCLFDTKPRTLSSHQIITLQAVAQQIEYLLDLREKELAYKNLLALISDETRNPLNLLLMQSSLISQLADNPEGQRVSEEIEKRIDNVIHILDTALDYSAVLQSEKALEPVACDIYSLAKDVIHVNEHSAQQKRLDIQLKKADETSKYLGFFDEGMIRHLFNIFIQDVLKHCLPNSQMELILSQQDSKIIVDIRDNGPKIRKQDATRLFRPLSSVVDRRAKNRTRGLGLFIANSIVKRHSGVLSYVQENETWTHFKIEFPVKE